MLKDIFFIFFFIKNKVYLQSISIFLYSKSIVDNNNLAAIKVNHNNIYLIKLP